MIADFTRDALWKPSIQDSFDSKRSVNWYWNFRMASTTFLGSS
jgi:hypothetical protein